MRCKEGHGGARRGRGGGGGAWRGHGGGAEGCGRTRRGIAMRCTEGERGMEGAWRGTEGARRGTEGHGGARRGAEGRGGGMEGARRGHRGVQREYRWVPMVFITKNFFLGKMVDINTWRSRIGTFSQKSKKVFYVLNSQGKKVIVSSCYFSCFVVSINMEFN